MLKYKQSVIINILPANQNNYCWSRRQMAEFMILYKYSINVFQQIIVETLVSTSANHPSKHCQPTKTIAVQFAIWQNQWMARTFIEQLRIIIPNGFNVHKTFWDPGSLVGKTIVEEEFFSKRLVLYFKHATIKLYLTLSHVALIAQTQQFWCAHLVNWNWP